jgi:hypothetical protein
MNRKASSLLYFPLRMAGTGSDGRELKKYLISGSPFISFAADIQVINKP